MRSSIVYCFYPVGNCTGKLFCFFKAPFLAAPKPLFGSLRTPDKHWFVVQTDAATDFVLFVLLYVVQDEKKKKGVTIPTRALPRRRHMHPGFAPAAPCSSAYVLPSKCQRDAG